MKLPLPLPTKSPGFLKGLISKLPFGGSGDGDDEPVFEDLGGGAFDADELMTPADDFQPESPERSGIIGAAMNIFGRRGLIIVSALSLVLIFSLAMIIVILAGSSGKDEAAAGDAEAAVEFAGETGEDPALKEKPFLSDFIIYEDVLEKRLTEPVYFREVVNGWSSEQVELFWVEPAEIGARLLELEADKTVKGIFADVR